MSIPRKTRTPLRWRRRHARCRTNPEDGGYTCDGQGCQAHTGKTARAKRSRERRRTGGGGAG